MRPRARGHTLLELVVVAAITAVLASLASAAYARFVDAARRADARAALLALASAQERHFLRHATYAQRLTAPDAEPDPGDAAALRWAELSPQGHYRVAILHGDVHGFRLAATPVGVQARDRECASLALDGTGYREARDARGRDSSRRCWGGA